MSGSRTYNRIMNFKALPAASARHVVAALPASCAATSMKGVSATRQWKTALLLQPAAHS